MRRFLVKCAGCGELKAPRKFIGERPYCTRCVRKVPPVAVILAVLADAECDDCGDETTGYQAELEEFGGGTYCIDCLAHRLQGMPEAVADDG